jgi:hypothetical protein
MEETERIQTTETTTATGGEFSTSDGTKAILRIKLSIGGCMAVCRLACSVSLLIESCIDFVQ